MGIPGSGRGVFDSCGLECTAYSILSEVGLTMVKCELAFSLSRTFSRTIFNGRTSNTYRGKGAVINFLVLVYSLRKPFAFAERQKEPHRLLSAHEEN